ncbi:MAG: tyrosine-type recombinase/integrase, partial [Treponema sp.]|nr:tyrosine-type recombinase/integrase [Treponema sp.]
EYVFDDYILVCGQYSEDGIGYKDYTKTRENRAIPLMPEMIALLRKLMKKNGKGFVFSYNGGAKPVSRAVIYYELHKALNKIGIDESEIKRRGLSIHGWRHFVNTELQRQGLSIPQVQSVTGHKSDRMTEWYNHPDARNIDDVIQAQSVIAGKAKTKMSKPADGDEGNQSRPGFQIIKKPETEPERKHA